MSCLLIDLLCDPAKATSFSPRQWDSTVPVAHVSGLSGSVYSLIENAQLLSAVPQEVLRHLKSGALVANKQHHDLDYELDCLREAFDEIGIKVILLKGAAYRAAGLYAGRGRLMSDIDLLVPDDRIQAAEDILKQHGWDFGDLHPYDERYFREWMHEIPALGHTVRGSTLDVHHTIVPPTAGYALDASKLFEHIVEVKPGIFTLAPTDMVIHSATHLFHEGEFGKALRDLRDLDQLMREFASQDNNFWHTLIKRAEELDLSNPLFYGLRYAREHFGTPVPDQIRDTCQSQRRSSTPVVIMDVLYRRAFIPEHSSCRLTGTGLARFLLYIRSHYLRMPLRLLIPHLTRKWWRGIKAQDNETQEQQ